MYYFLFSSRYLPSGTTMAGVHKRLKGLSSSQANIQRKMFGENFIKIEVRSIWQLLIQQV